MGIFSSKKKTYVSSVVYNLAGDEFKRPNYLRTTVVGTVLNNSPSLSNALSNSYIDGPGMRFRRFHRWAERTNYNDLIGLVTGAIQTGNSLDYDAIAAEIPGAIVPVQSASIGIADYTYWADQHVLENFPTLISTDYEADFDEEANLITITWVDTTTTSFTPVGYNKASTYLYVVYSEALAASTMLLFIYEYNSGNAVLDAMFEPSAEMNGFYPVIPIRLKNEFLSKTVQPEIYEAARKGYKKATTGKLHKLVEQLEDNEDIDDIDYIYIVFGVCLNVMEQASRKYIYKFFEEILNDFTLSSEAELSGWNAEWEAARDSWDAWVAWEAAQSIPSDPLYGTPEPIRLTYPSLPANTLKVTTGANPTINYDMTIGWTSISESFGLGLIEPDATRDQVWITKGDSTTYEESIWADGEDEFGNPIVGAVAGATQTSETIVINWQLTTNTWRKLTITGLTHKNLIYGGKFVEISAFEALDDPEESGFIIPLHDGVFRAMGLVDGTQMTTACSYLVMNSYTVVKQKWYQRGFFKIILLIIIVVIAVYTGYIDPNAVGVLGANAAVGSILVGTAATIALQAIVGAVANAIAAMLLARMITAGATKLFGEKWGAVIGAIASLVAMDVGTALGSGQTLAQAFGNLMRADNILQLTQAVGNGVSGYMRAGNAEIMAETQAVVQNYQAESRAIREAWMQNLGSGNGIIDPAVIQSAFGVTYEEIDSFLQRTLLTGSDIAEMSMEMLTNFVGITINTDLPT